MKKLHYFFIVSSFVFRKHHVNPSYDVNDRKKDVCEFIQKEIYGLEQKNDEPDEKFYQSLKKTAYEALNMYADTWIEKQKSTCESGSEWKLDSVEIENISKVS